MKKFLMVLLMLVLVTLAVTPWVSASEALTGKCGDDLTWTMDGNTLTISGTGPMYNYSEENPAPWKSIRGLSKAIIEEGVTAIGDYAFANSGAGSVSADVAASVTSVGKKAFAYRQSVVFFHGSAPTIAADAFDDGFGRLSYVSGWEASDLQSYGGRHDWYKATLAYSNDAKRLYARNEQLQAADFKFKAFYNGNQYYMYTPQVLEIEAYDNSTLGEKTVKVNADGTEFSYTYFVTDGQAHLDMVYAQQPAPQYYTGSAIKPELVVKAGSFTLQNNVHYTLSYKNNVNAGADAKITVTGIGEWEGISETVTFRILRQDVSNANITWRRANFSGDYVMPTVNVTMDKSLKSGTDYVVYYQNNVNMGKAQLCVVGIGNYCGYAMREFEISNVVTSNITLKGAYNGTVGGSIGENAYYEEAVVTPGVQTFRIDSVVGSTMRDHTAAYQLYRMEGDDLVLVDTKETAVGYGETTQYVYDFSSVYEDAAEDGLAVYILSYAWADSRNEIYAGVYVMYIPAKVPDATSMVVEQVEVEGGFRRAYLTAYGPDGNVGPVDWISSDESVATVKDGVVTFQKPGTVTVTGRYGNMEDSIVVSAEAQDLRQISILHWDAQTEIAYLHCADQQLVEGVDYTLLVTQQNDIVRVTATGCGLFSGQIVREFSADTGKAVDHTHSFDGCVDATCATCSFTREASHRFSEQWTKNSTHHWHICEACGEQTAAEPHNISAADDTVCTVCGLLYTPGDLNGDEKVNEDDAIYLLQYILLPEYFSISQDADYVRDNKVNEDDAIYLLQHVLLPEFFPLEEKK